MELMVLNTEFVAVDVIDFYESLIWTDRYNSCGDFEIVLPVNDRTLTAIKEDYYLLFDESEHVMIIESIKIESDVEEGNKMTVTGRSLESILDRRIIWGQKTYEGKLQTEMLSMLNDAFIIGDRPGRKVDNFVFLVTADSAITELTISNQYTGDNLYNVVVELCEENHIGFKITLSDDHRFQFSLYHGEDRSYSQSKNPYVVFSPDFENLLNSNYFTSNTEYKNVTLVAGEGEGSDRRTTEVISVPVEGLNRRELFTDARDISSTVEGGSISDDTYITLLTNRGNSKLAECSKTNAFEGEAEGSSLFVYGKDFFIGDIVQIEDDYDNKTMVYVSELVFSSDTNGETIYPTFKTYKKED